MWLSVTCDLLTQPQTTLSATHTINNYVTGHGFVVLSRALNGGLVHIHIVEIESHQLKFVNMAFDECRYAHPLHLPSRSCDAANGHYFQSTH
jgi:hypothetical protein